MHPNNKNIIGKSKNKKVARSQNLCREKMQNSFKMFFFLEK
jgi:hypothetical protein